MELPVTKSPKIIQFSVGHDGSHALLVAEDGSVFFTGSASKGEDGESSKKISECLQHVLSPLDLCLILKQCPEIITSLNGPLFSVAAKSRRQPKPYKPKKMIKLETKTAVYTACNNGSSSIVTKDGELYMFGKDAIYSDSTCE